MAAHATTLVRFFFSLSLSNLLADSKIRTILQGRSSIERSQVKKIGTETLHFESSQSIFL